MLGPIEIAASSSARAVIDFDPGTGTVASTGCLAVGVAQGTGAFGSSVRTRRGGRPLEGRLPGSSAAGIAGPPLALIIPVCPGEAGL
ncbi:hypothetical protein Asera_30440 [Actinocatenispora sera]|uniref:Uncharacterized protein n=1 Tax=Actinocatenispora sera TaxID=390989 RepID=A0A810L3F3_9ACTN|nr:hypothetical protein Asera_30440 [Actinocatenispora sera]